MNVSISDLKARLSRYLRRVRAGEELVVTDRGRPVARLMPLRGVQDQDARIQRLVRSGRLRAPIAGLPADFWERPRPADPDGRALFTLLEERAEGR